MKNISLNHLLRFAFLFALAEAAMVAGMFLDRKQYGWTAAWLFLALICSSLLLQVQEAIVINRISADLERKAKLVEELDL